MVTVLFHILGQSLICLSRQFHIAFEHDWIRWTTRIDVAVDTREQGGYTLRHRWQDMLTSSKACCSTVSRKVECQCSLCIFPSKAPRVASRELCTCMLVVVWAFLTAIWSRAAPEYGRNGLGRVIGILARSLW